MDKLTTEPYKGVRDFYPEDMAVQEYIFDVWRQTAEQFGYLRYDASVFEPASLYKAKGAENEEIVNEQSYTFTDRGGREVTLRPEMTPTVARMIASKQKELAFPVRWYSIPNLFRYERAQRGRLREHWQLNCDIFGALGISADIEIILLAYQILINFGATEEMFEIRVNDRAAMDLVYTNLGITHADQKLALTRLNDRKDKIDQEAYRAGLVEILSDESLVDAVISTIESTDDNDNKVVAGLKSLGVGNVRLDRSLARGFDYYTGTVFEIFDTNPKNNRAMLGGGRYDSLTTLFGQDAVSGVGFGMGDVTLRHFLESNNILTANLATPTIVVLPMNESFELSAQVMAQRFRSVGIRSSVDLSARKMARRLNAAADQLIEYALVLGEDEISTGRVVLKHLHREEEHTGTLDELLANDELVAKLAK